MIVVVGLSHKTAPIEVRERLAINKDALPGVLRRLLDEPAVGEAMVLSTCNRVEIYAAPVKAKGKGAGGRDSSGRDLSGRDSNGRDLSGRDSGGRGAGPRVSDPPPDLDATARAVTKVLASIGGDAASSHLIMTPGKAAIRHLFRVAASLDSLVLGEPQILGQLKEAIEAARVAGALGMTLGRAAGRAIRVGKRVRTETALGAGQVSISSVAVDLAQQIFEELAGRVTLLIGAGEMAEAASKLLVRAGARLIVVNRSLDRAKALARDLGEGARSAEARSFSDLERSLVEADIVISSTSSPNYVVTPQLVKAAFKGRRGRSLFFIDIAVPRDVDPAVNKLDNVFLYDIDDLSQIVAESRGGRAAEAARAEAIVAEEEEGMDAWNAKRALTPTIVALRTRTRALLAAEMERSLAGKLRHLAKEDRDALAIMLDAATNRLLHTPVTRLRALAGDVDMGADEHAEALRHLFDLQESQDPAPAAASASAEPGSPRPSIEPDPAIEATEIDAIADDSSSTDQSQPTPSRAGPPGHDAENERANL